MIPDVTSAPSNEAGATVVQFNYCVSDHHFSSGRVEVSGLSTTSPSMMVLRGVATHRQRDRACDLADSYGNGKVSNAIEQYPER